MKSDNGVETPLLVVGFGKLVMQLPEHVPHWCLYVLEGSYWEESQPSGFLPHPPLFATQVSQVTTQVQNLVVSASACMGFVKLLWHNKYKIWQRCCLILHNVRSGGTHTNTWPGT